jgi:hypothetical protein
MGFKHYQMPLPLKTDVHLPNNKPMAEKRVVGLKRKMLRNPGYKNDYTDFMGVLIANGYAEPVPPDETDVNSGKVWYIPHHGVYHPHKPSKIRVVFDCSAEFAGEALNRHLLQGPDMTNNLVGVLCRFRKGQIAVTCDIEGMFHQVGVNEEHRNLLRFLWWEGGNLDSHPKEYRMTVHLFGATSSPGCANFALKRAASDHEQAYGKDAADFIRNEFYVDDGCASRDGTPEEVTTLIKGGIGICEKGGFRLHKITSNNKQVLSAFPPSERGKSIQTLDLHKDSLPDERTLGTVWCIESDTFTFRVELRDKPLTRRGILSSVSSVFDPLGLVAPFILTGRQILKELCDQGADWDDPVPEDVRMKWERWRLQLPELENLKIPRTFTSQEMSKAKTIELHNFSDASMSGYGQCSYLRVVSPDDKVETALVMSKSRVVPAKTVTIPRLELTAALSSVKVGVFLGRELKIEALTQVYYFNDISTVCDVLNSPMALICAGTFIMFAEYEELHCRPIGEGNWEHEIPCLPKNELFELHCPSSVNCSLGN